MNIEEYANAVEDTLQYWLDIHTNAERWAEEWTMDDIEYSFSSSPILSNNYFYFDWKKAAIRRQAIEWRNLFNICKRCGCINKNGYDSCCENPQQGRKPTINELSEWILETETNPSESAKLEALQKDGFKAYRAGIKDTISPVVSEVKETIKSIRKAKNGLDKLQSIIWANHVCHVNGNIIRDYGDRFGIDYKTVDGVSQDGLISMFSQEEIDEYVKD